MRQCASIRHRAKFCGGEGEEGQKCVTTPNFTVIGQALAEIWRFFDFSRWRPPPSWIFKCGKFRGGKGSRRPKHVTVPNFAEIGQTVAVIWPFFDLSMWWKPPSWILKMWKF